MDRKLLDLLVCPATRQPLALLDSRGLQALNAAIQAGGVLRGDGTPQAEAVREALVTRDYKTVYRVDDGIPVLLVEESIATAQVADFPANALLFGCGGIVAHYPTEVPLHFRSTHLPPGRDLFGETLQAAHRRGIRVIGRFDFSKAPRPVYDAHPEWFFRTAAGQPVVDESGLHVACINGGYYREHAPRVLDEALSRLVPGAPDAWLPIRRVLRV